MMFLYHKGKTLWARSCFSTPRFQFFPHTLLMDVANNALKESAKINVTKYGYISPLVYQRYVEPQEKALELRYRNRTRRNVSRSTSPGMVEKMKQMLNRGQTNVQMLGGSKKMKLRSRNRRR